MAWMTSGANPRETARGFASDNAAGVHPAVLEAITKASAGHAFGYGHDRWTERTEALLQEQFGSGSRPFLVWGGTAANVLSLRACCRPWEAAICAASAHLNVDEAGAPEGIASVKLLAAEVAALLSDGLWRSLADHANQMAARLAALIGNVQGLTITRPVEANAVFATLPEYAVAHLQEQFDFYVWDEKRSEVRFMCSW